MRVPMAYHAGLDIQIIGQRQHNVIEYQTMDTWAGDIYYHSQFTPSYTSI
jgi:hypothetical protein